jgi:ABC-type nickel/cobalt efflux system permease component RcnA
MISIRENIPVIIGIIVVAVVAWILWREVSKLRKSVTTVIKEHNETASVLDQHKNAINGLSTQLTSAYQDEDDEYDGEDEYDDELDDEIEDDAVQEKLPTIVEIPESSGKAKKRA